MLLRAALQNPFVINHHLGNGPYLIVLLSARLQNDELQKVFGYPLVCRMELQKVFGERERERERERQTDRQTDRDRDR